MQLGKQRAGWYMTRRTEKFFFPSARGIRSIDPRRQALRVGDRIPDYGKDGYFDCFYLERDSTIGYTSTRGKVTMTWVLTFWPASHGTRVVIRLHATGFGALSRRFMAVGKLFDRMTIAWLAAGMHERLSDATRGDSHSSHSANLSQSSAPTSQHPDTNRPDQHAKRLQATLLTPTP